MAIDQPLNKKRGRPPCTKMEQKLALVKRRLAILDSSGSDNDGDNNPMLSKRATPAKTEQMSLVVSQKPAMVNDDKNNTNLMNTTQDRKRESPSKEEKKLSIVVTQQPIEIDDDEEDGTPLRFTRSRLAKIEQKKLTVVAQTHKAHSTNTGLINTIEVSAVNDQKKCGSVKPMVEARNSPSVRDKSESTMRRAEELRAKLPANNPSFAKHMLRSHVTLGFWLGLPTVFCNKHLPKHDINVVLEDESGNKFDVKYLGSKQGLSGGWRGFSIDHNIKEGDVVVFQLVSSLAFKVYIVRANGITAADGALALLSLEACAEDKRLQEEHAKNVRSKKEKDGKLLSCSSSKVSLNDSDDQASEVIDGIRFSESVVVFEDVRTFKNFNIIVDGLVIDTKFPEHLRRTYYELCRSQKSFLHKNLLKGFNLTLVVGVITETINIADGIRACKACDSSRDDLLIWKKTLEAFELLGMNVACLLDRLGCLLSLAIQAKEASESDKYKDVKLERARAGEKMKLLESKLSKLMDALKNLDVEMEEMASSMKNSDLKLQQIASAPW